MKKIVILFSLLIFTTSCNRIVGGFGNQIGRRAGNDVYNHLLPILVIGIVVLIILGICGAIFGKKQAKKNKEEIDAFLLKTREEFKTEGLNIIGWNEIELEAHKKGINWLKLKYEFVLKQGKRKKNLISKYGDEKGEKIYNKDFYLNMTKEELIDSTGEPDKIETDVLKTKTKETWIYGNKSSGDVFVFENNILTRFKDR